MLFQLVMYAENTGYFYGQNGTREGRFANCFVNPRDCIIAGTTRPSLSGFNI